MKEVSCSGKKDGAIYVTAIGAYVPVSYLWSNGATTSAITGLNPDSFSVKITDAYGCKAYTGLILTSPPAMVISPVSNFQISYGGSQQVSIRVLPDTPGYIYLWSPTVGLSCTDCPSPIVSPLLSTSYTLTVAQSATGCRDSITFSVFVEGLNHIYVPNAFTPNGDGVNDVHHISFSGTILFYEMEIFDRWGEMVYRSNDPERGWDGTFKSAKLPPENYTYQMSVTFATGEPIHTKGAITLIR
jgi:gliding motility-associated-like protein